MRCSGNNASGQLGDGTQTDQTTPDTVTGLSNADGLAAGGDYTCTVVTTANAYCWGSNPSGQLGDNTTTQRLTPTLVLPVTA